MRCTYCNDPYANTIDHVVPRSAKSGQTNEKRYVVPCCHECNCVLGAKPYYTVSSRAGYLASVYRKRYKDVLKLKHWDQAEIDQLSGRMQVLIEIGQANKKDIAARIEFCEYREALCQTVAEIWEEIE